MIKIKRYINKLYQIRHINLIILILIGILILWNVLNIISGPVGMLCGFDYQVRYLLKTQMMTADEINQLSTVFQQLQRTLQERWPGTEVVPLGSSITGLCMKFSDADCMITIPNHNIYNATVDKYLNSEAVRLLKKYPDLYTNVRIDKRKSKNQISILKFNFVPTGKVCDVNFVDTHGLEITTMIAYYYSLDDRVLTVAAIVKLWSIIDWRMKTGVLASYTLNLLIIFYFQHEGILPPFYFIENQLGRGVPELWRHSNRKNIYQLLRGFFDYYKEFDFDNYVISVLLGRPINIQEFEDTFSVPEKLSSHEEDNLLEEHVTSVSDGKLYVQDAIPPRGYVIEPITSQIPTFKSLTKHAAEMFRRIPSDRILSIIMGKNKSYEIFKDCNCFNIL